MAKGNKNGGNHIRYSKEEISIMQKYYPKYGGSGKRGCVARIKKKLDIDRNIRGLCQKARKLGLIYNGEKKGVFKKGQEPVNKGKKMSKETYEKVKHTFFKKGRQPKNTKFDGAYSWRVGGGGFGYWYIRASKSNWVLLHRYLWERSYNIKLGTDDIIRFKDGNSRNVCLSNLERISKAGHLFRNNPRLDYPQEVLDIMEAINKLNNKIKKVKDGTK